MEKHNFSWFRTWKRSYNTLKRIIRFSPEKRVFLFHMSKTYSPLVSLLKKRFYFGFTHKKLFLLNKDFFCWKKKNVLLKIKFFWVGGFTCGNTNVLLVLFMENTFSLIKKKKKVFLPKKSFFVFTHGKTYLHLVSIRFHTWQRKQVLKKSFQLGSTYKFFSPEKKSKIFFMENHNFSWCHT